MIHYITCNCGKVLSVDEANAGSWTSCSCGNGFRVPSLSSLRAQSQERSQAICPHDFPVDLNLDEAITAQAPSAPVEGGDLSPFDESTSETNSAKMQVDKVIPPTPASMRAGHGGWCHVMAALTPSSVWIQEAWRTRSIPLAGLVVEKGKNGKQLVLVSFTGDAASLVLAFNDAATADRWAGEMRRQQVLEAGGAPCTQGISYQPEGVSLVSDVGDVPHRVMGELDFTSLSSWAADRGLQLGAAMCGADAVINVCRQKCPELGWGACQTGGTLVRLEDADSRKRLRLRFYAEQVQALALRLFWLLFAQGVVLFVVSVFFQGSSLQMPTGETLAAALVSASLGFVALFLWPFVVVLLLVALRWPGLLLPAALAVVASTTGRVVTVLLVHIVAVKSTGAALGKTEASLFLDPFGWVILICGGTLFARAIYLVRDAHNILPDELQVPSTSRIWLTRGVLTASILYGLALLGFVAASRYENSIHLLQPGVDTRREQAALLAMNEGIEHFDRSDLAAAERSWKWSVDIWEDLTRPPAAPMMYRANLAQTYYNLGLLCEKQNRFEEADKNFAHVARLAPALEAEPKLLSPAFKETLADARRMTFFRREQQALQAMNQGQDQFVAGDLAAAEKSWQRALREWEELLKLPKASPAFRANHAQALYNLGFVSEKRLLPDEAVKYYLQVVNLAPQLEAAPHLMTPQLRQILDDSRRALAELRR